MMSGRGGCDRHDLVIRVDTSRSRRPLPFRNAADRGYDCVRCLDGSHFTTLTQGRIRHFPRRLQSASESQLVDGMSSKLAVDLGNSHASRLALVRAPNEVATGEGRIWERPMHEERSLRFLVEKWLMPAPATPIRVTRFSRTRADWGRDVRVEALRLNGSVALFFFRHDDGAWRVFPPAAKRLAMRVSASVAG
jgi:hypothetical protein